MRQVPASELKPGDEVVTPDKEVMRIVSVDRNPGDEVVQMIGETRKGGRYQLASFANQPFIITTTSLWVVIHEGPKLEHKAYLVAVDVDSGAEFSEDEAGIIELLGINYSPTRETLMIAPAVNFPTFKAYSLRDEHNQPIPFYIKRA